MEFVICSECGYEVAECLAFKNDKNSFCSTDCLSEFTGFTYVRGDGGKIEDTLLAKILLAGL